MTYIFGKKLIIFVIGVTVLFGLFFIYKAGRTITVIGSGASYFWDDDLTFFPKIPDREDNRIDILILGIRGIDGKDEEKDSNGDFLADTIIIASFNTDNKKASIVSIPRDLYVDIPGYGKEKINSAYAVGENRHYGGGGLELMKLLLSSISGVYIDHAVSIDFEGFKKIVDDIGGITIYRDTPFEESRQWVLDGREGKRYWRLDEETGWTFYVPEGENVMNSEEALYYVRSRYSSSDFDRMRRQQEVISAIKSKTLNLGVLANPIKILNILSTIENNVRIDIPTSYIKELIGMVRKSKLQSFQTAILETGDSGLLTADNIDGRFVLLPRTGDYSEIRELFRKIVE